MWHLDVRVPRPYHDNSKLGPIPFVTRWKDFRQNAKEVDMLSIPVPNTPENKDF